jgi:pyruvate,orthophosphate dikinase
LRAFAVANAPGRVRYVYDVGALDASDPARFGGKGVGLARMARAGIPVPPAFVVSTDAFRAFADGGGVLPAGLREEVDAALARLEAATGKRFAGEGPPLLVSVRSGSKVSMPGMMDTVLNLGLDARSAARLARATGPRFAVDTWARFWCMFADIVLRMDAEELGARIAEPARVAQGSGSDEAFAALERAILDAIDAQAGAAPVDPRAQLDLAISAVFQSWDSRRAKAYRQHHGIPDELGTAVTVQAMVFGNYDARSGSGVAFTRNPNTGGNELYGEYLTGRQGEELVSGATTPVDLSDPQAFDAGLRETLTGYGRQLESLYRDALDIEFTVESSKLYLLQVRSAKRTAQAAVRIAVDMVSEGILSEHEALGLVSAEQIKRLLRPAFDPEALARADLLAQGVGSSPGHAFGAAILDADRAAELAAAGEPVILMRPTTSPQDIRGMLAARGIVTARGGALSHAAVVSRALDKPCVVGCDAIGIDLAARRFEIAGRAFPEGTPVSIDGASGRLYAGILPLQAAMRDEGALGRILAWADAGSGASFWVGVRSAAEAKAAAQLRPAGLGVIGLTDLLISVGTVDELIEAIGEVSGGDNGPETADKLAHMAYEACRRLLLETPNMRVDLRLPNLSSPRAQRMIQEWAGLTPKLFLPLGEAAYYRPLLRGVASAAAEMSHGGVTALIGGVTEAAELERFRAAAAQAGIPAVGAVIQNVAALHQAPAMLASNCALWVDLHEIIRTSHGFPNELLFADGVFDSYAQDGCIAVSPRSRLKPFLRDLLLRLIERGGGTGGRIGVDCGAAVNPSFVGELYDSGYRTFSVPDTQHASTRLTLGQRATEVRYG